MEVRLLSGAPININMKIKELTESLILEYITKGKIDASQKTFMLPYETKYILILNGDNFKDFSFGNGISFSLNQAGNKAIVDLLDDFSNEAELKQQLENKKEEVKEVFKNYAELSVRHKINSSEIVSFFKEELMSAKPEKFASATYSGLVYGSSIKSSEQLNQLKRIEAAIGSPTAYVEIDHKEKTIKRVDETKRGQSRMKGYKGNSEYVLIGGAFSIDVAQYAKIVKQIKHQLPGYTVEEDDKLTDIANKLDKIISGKGSITAFHGTSLAIAKKVKKAKGLKPGLGPEYGDKIVGHSENMVYLTLLPETARKYAVRAAKTSPNVILEVKINDLSKLRFDEDSLWDAVNKLLESEKKNDKLIVQMIHKAFPSEYNRSHHTYIELIRDEITSDYTRHQKNLLMYIKFKALHTANEMSFAYAGSIPLKDISVFEESQSEKYKDDDDDQYDRIQSVTKSGQNKEL